MNSDQKIKLWRSLANREYRDEFADQDITTGIAFQIRHLREKTGLSQEALARKIGNSQETISQWENPNYGRYTLSSLKQLRAAFDVALLIKFVPFSKLVEWTTNLTPERLAPPTYDEECSFARSVIGNAAAPHALVDSASNPVSQEHTVAETGSPERIPERIPTPLRIEHEGRSYAQAA